MPDVPSQHTTYFELRDAMLRGGCPVCPLASSAATRYMDALLFESVTDPDARLVFAASQGVCNPHAWQMVESGGASGIAIVYRGILNDVRRALAADTGRAEPSGLSRLWRGLGGPSDGDDTWPALRPTQSCPACRARDERAALLVDVLLDHVGDDEMAQAYRASAGLCLPHLRLALGRARDTTPRARLAALQVAVWQRLDDELAELIRKFDYRFAREPMGEEGDTWIRAVEAIAGRRGLGIPLPG